MKNVRFAFKIYIFDFAVYTVLLQYINKEKTCLGKNYIFHVCRCHLINFAGVFVISWLPYQSGSCLILILQPPSLSGSRLILLW